jgi:hypothetical protein
MGQLSNQNDVAWKAHVQASINMYLRGQDEDWREFGRSYEARRAVSAGISAQNHDTNARRILAGFDFMMTTIFRLDVISSITVRITPTVLLQRSQIPQPDLAGTVQRNLWL